jgi:hypothetical protein
VHDDRRGVLRDLGDPDADRLRPGRASRDRRRGLPGPELLGEEDGRLLPARGRDDDDRVDPVARVQPLEALREQGAVAQARERLRAVRAESLAAPRGGEDGPDAPAAENA